MAIINSYVRLPEGIWKSRKTTHMIIHWTASNMVCFLLFRVAEWPKKNHSAVAGNTFFWNLGVSPFEKQFFYMPITGVAIQPESLSAEVPQDGDLQALRLSGAWSRLTSEGLGGCQHPNLAHWCHHQARRNVTSVGGFIWKFGFDFVFYRFFWRYTDIHVVGLVSTSFSTDFYRFFWKIPSGKPT